MLLQFLTIRSRQLYRLGKELGVLRSIFILIAFAVLCAVLPTLTDKSPYIISIATIALTWAIHSQRQDGTFLKLLNIKKSRLYFVEYLCLNLPVLLAFIFSEKYRWFDIAIIALLFYISEKSVPRFSKKFSLGNFRLAPSLLFEYISGLRINLFPLLILYVIALALSFTVFAVPVFIILYTFTVCNFNTECEPRSFIEVFGLPAKAFLLKKVRLQVIFTLFLFVPLLILYLVFNANYWYILLYACLIAVICISFSIVYKYTLYQPGETLGGNNILNSFAIISFLIPFLIPIVPIMLIKYYNRAIENLYNYTYA